MIPYKALQEVVWTANSQKQTCALKSGRTRPTATVTDDNFPMVTSNNVLVGGWTPDLLGHQGFLDCSITTSTLPSIVHNNTITRSRHPCLRHHHLRREGRVRLHCRTSGNVSWEKTRDRFEWQFMLHDNKMRCQRMNIFCLKCLHFFFLFLHVWPFNTGGPWKSPGPSSWSWDDGWNRVKLGRQCSFLPWIQLLFICW